MNEPSLTPDQRADLVDYFFERAHESIDEAYAFRDASSVAFLLPKAESFIDAVETLVRNN